MGCNNSLSPLNCGLVLIQCLDQIIRFSEIVVVNFYEIARADHILRKSNFKNIYILPV